jgi:hypothetical protein
MLLQALWWEPATHAVIDGARRAVFGLHRAIGAQAHRALEDDLMGLDSVNDKGVYHLLRLIPREGRARHDDDASRPADPETEKEIH